MFRASRTRTALLLSAAVVVNVALAVVANVGSSMIPAAVQPFFASETIWFTFGVVLFVAVLLAVVPSSPATSLRSRQVLGPFPVVSRPSARGANEVSKLRNAIRRNRVVEIVGPAGAGKSQLVARAGMTWRRFARVVWVDASSEASLIDGLAHFGAKAETVHGVASRHRALAVVAGWRSSTARTLLVLDGADRYSDIEWLLGHEGNVWCVVTSIHQGVSGAHRVVDVPQLTPERAKRLLERITRQRDIVSGELVKELGFSPLSIAQAGAFINSEGLSLAQYRDEYIQQGQLPAVRPPGDEQHRTAYQVVAAYLENAIVKAADVAQLPRQTVKRVVETLAFAEPMALSTTSVEHGFGMSRLEARRLTTAIRTYSIALRISGQRISLHSIVALVARDRASDKMWTESLIPMLRSAVDRYPASWEGLSAVALARLLIENAVASQLPSLTPTLLDLARKLFSQGDYEIAEEVTYYLQGSDFFRDSQEDDWLDSRDLHAHVVLALGRSSESVMLYRANLAQRQARKPEGFSELIRCEIDMANAIRSAGRVEESLALLWDCVVQSRARLGEQAEIYLYALGSYGFALLVSGDASSAVAVLGEASLGRTALMGPNDPFTLIARHNFARALMESGQTSEALQEFKALSKDRNAVFGPKHPQTLITRHHAARAMAAKGQYVRARKAAKSVVADRTKTLGPNHPDTLRSIDLLQSIGKPGQ